MFSDHRCDLRFVFHTGFFFRTKKNGVLLRRTVSGDSLAHFFLFSAELTLGKGEHLGMRATILVVSNLIPAIEMSMYNAKFYIINFQGIYYYVGDQKNKKGWDLFIFFGFKTGFVLFFAYRLGFQDSSSETFGKISFSVFRSWSPVPSRGSHQMQATSESVCVKHQQLLLGETLELSFLLFSQNVQ